MEEEIKKTTNYYNSEAAVENVLEWLRGSKEISGTLCKGKMYNKVMALAKKNPDEVKIEVINDDGSIFFHMPISYLHLYAPTKRELSEEEKEIARERLAQYRNK